MAGKRKVRWGRVAILLSPFIFLIALLCTKCFNGQNPAEESSRPKATLEGSIPDQTGSAGNTPSVPENKIYTVVIDAGHGGKDGGCTDPTETRLEKDDNLRLSLRVCEYLQAYPRVHVIMTRTDDTFVSLSERCRIANEANADIFVSLHRNTASNASGIEVWINNAPDSPNSPIERSLAGHICELLADVGVSYNRGVRSGFRDSEDSSYAVNRDTKMPSCLVEMGFMSSDIDNSNFDRRLNEYADAIASAIMETAEDTNLMYTPDSES